MPRAPRLALAAAVAVPALLLAGSACSGRVTSASPADRQDAADSDPGEATDTESGSSANVADATSPADDADAELGPSCSELTLTLDPDATPGTCELSPADVACNTPADCTLLVVGNCNCTAGVYGVSKTSTASCPSLPCPPPNDGPCVGPGYVTQDCNETPYDQIGVTCVGHTCRTFEAIEH